MPFFKTCPDLYDQERLMLLGEYEDDEKIDLVCTAKLTTGLNRYDVAHERVFDSCEMRDIDCMI